MGFGERRLRTLSFGDIDNGCSKLDGIALIPLHGDALDLSIERSALFFF